MSEGILFTAPERHAARDLQELLEQLLEQGGPLQQLRIIDEQAVARAVAVPTVALRLLADALDTLATGQAVEVVPLVRGTKD